MMVWRGVRSQLLFVALAPAILVAALLTAVFLYGRVSDLSEAHAQRADALARQLAANAEFGLFSGNRPGLQLLADAVLREPDVEAVTILDRDGAVVARAGRSAPTALARDIAATPAPGGGPHYLVRQPVSASVLSGDPLFEGTAGRPAQHLGEVVLELSRENLQKLERTIVLVGVLVTLAGLLFGSLLAVRLSRSVSRPLMDLAQAVERVGRGELEARVQVERASPLHGLEDGVNRMAARLEQARDQLERRIADATAELRLKKDEAERANVAKSRFVAAASHDLRQPMHALGLFVDNLRDEVGGGERARRLVEGMRSSIDAMTAMFDALLDISRLDAGVIAVERSDFPVRRLLRRMETLFTPLALERGLRFSVVGSSVWVYSDPALLERVVQNLVSNALKHTRAGGVLVGCRRLARTVAIQVWDTGPGIPAEHLDQIFQEFFQLTNPERDRAKGLGLGLAIVDRIARLLGHRVHVRSTPGRGTVFSVEVPYGDAGAAGADPVQLELIADRFAGVCVAVLDDDRASLEAMTGLLERWRCTVLAADSEDALLDRIRERAVVPELLITDLRLREGRTGIQAVGRIREALGRPVQAILISGDTAPEALIAARASGLDLQHKPLAPEKLMRLMRLLLGRPAQLQASPARDGEHDAGSE